MLSNEEIADMHRFLKMPDGELEENFMNFNKYYATASAIRRGIENYLRCKLGNPKTDWLKNGF